MSRISTVLIGDESLVIGCADLLLEQGHAILAIVTTDAGIAGWAEEKSLPVMARIADLEAMPKGSFGWLLSIANLRIIPDAILALPSCGAVNFHDGPLPHYAGLNTPAWAIWHGETEHGITWHLIEGGVDEGDILTQRMFEIAPDETAFSLNAKCYAAAMESFPALLDQLVSGELRRQAQDLGQRRYFGRDARPDLAGWLDTDLPAADLARQARALDFGDYRNPLSTPKVILGTEWVQIGHVTAEDSVTAAAAGTVLELVHDALRVATGAGVLHLAGLRSLRGRRVDPASHVAVGDLVGRPDPGDTAVVQRAARAEAIWLGALQDMAPVPLPLAAAASGAATWDCHDFAAQVSKADLALAALALARMSTGEVRAAVALGQEAPAFVSGWVPVSVPHQTPLGEARERVARQLSDHAAHGAYPADLTLRDPRIAGLEQPDIAVADLPMEGSVMTLCGTDGTLRMHVDTARLSPEAAALMRGRLQTILERMDGAQTLVELGEMPAAERARALRDWNATETDAPQEPTLHAAFEAQVARSPEATALVFEDETLSYAALNARADGLAARLRAAGVGPGHHVALCVARGPQLLIGALAILKAGGAYVPLDPQYPADRLAHYLSDSEARVIVTEAALCDTIPPSEAAVVLWDEAGPGAPVDGGAGPDDLAYVIYTSGSTGTPKAVMVSHRNVSNFFTGMDGVIDERENGVWLAVTSLAFDISVLELFYTLARGFKLVLISDEGRVNLSNGPIGGSGKRADFSLYYWSNDCDAGRGKYELLLEGAKFADANGFDALWTPERHFHAFGGPYPNPAVTGAAVAAITTNIHVRAGSCVAPLHHPARIAEEWAVIDNLTNGRTGLAMASGWHPDDFVLRPENTPPNNKAGMFETIDQVRRLWRGEEVAFPTASGEMHAVLTQPRPVSSELPIWLTTAGNPQTWREAGAIGANVLTHLLGQSIEEVGEKITLYHQALRDAGFDPANHTVTVMLHTLIGEYRERVMETAREPLKAYLRSAAGLIKQYAWAFPAFKKPQGVSNPFELDLSALDADEMEAILDFAFERYFFDAGLFGTVEDGIARVEQLKQLGVGEIACLIDYGVPNADVLAGLTHLNQVRERSNAEAQLHEGDYSLAAQLIRHRVTHMQCTPSMARMMAMNDEARMALGGLRQLYLGGEALSGALLGDLRRATRAKITNMYGPTETTIWSTCQVVEGDGKGQAVLPIGAALANQSVYVLDVDGAPVPVGVAGELCIGGAGVARGYWRRDDLTAERFVEGPEGGRVYRTGDLVRWCADGRLAFIGRDDHQVKIRGQRIELGEIEARIAASPDVREVVVVARETPSGETELAAYLTVCGALNEAALRADLAVHLPEVMVPRHIVTLERFPLTPNKKIDRKALPEPQAARAPVADAAPLPGSAGDVACIWARILGVAPSGGPDSFFDLGGHSLLAVQAHREIRKELEVPNLSITDIFRFPTLAALSSHIDRLRGAVASEAAAPASGGDDERAETISRRKAMRAARERRTG